MKLLDDLLAALPEGDVIDVCVGLRWTAVVIESDGKKRCGLASTLVASQGHTGEPDVPLAGRLQEMSAMELARYACVDHPTLASIGSATINALLPPLPELWRPLNAEEVIAAHGAGKTVALIGRFPFISRLRERVGELFVLERNPDPGELPAESAATILPTAEVVAITSMTLINRTFENLMRLCSPDAVVMLLGPSTPLSPILFDFGIDFLSGSVVTMIEPVLHAVAQGANFRQIHKIGVQLVTMTRYNKNILTG